MTSERSTNAGDAAALEALIPLVYDGLRRLAHHYLRGERPGHTLQSTALENEAYLPLVGQRAGEINNRAYFSAVAAHVVRRVLVDSSRARRASKLDCGIRVELEEAIQPAQSVNVDAIALDEALKRLEQFDSKLCRIVMLIAQEVDHAARRRGGDPW